MRTAHFLPIVALTALLSVAGCGDEGDDGGVDPGCTGEQCYASIQFGLEYKPPSPYLIADKEIVENSRLIMIIMGEPMPGEFKIIVDRPGVGTHDMLYELEQEDDHIKVVGSTTSTDGTSYWVATGELTASNGHIYRFELSIDPGSPSFPSLFSELVAGVTLLD